MRNIFRIEFKSVFSTPSGATAVHHTASSYQGPRFETIHICEADFVRVSAKLKLNSAPGPDGIPAILVKKTIGSMGKPPGNCVVVIAADGDNFGWT